MRRSAKRRRRRGPVYFARRRRWLRAPRQLRPTRAGWSFFVFTFGVGFAALNTGNNLLYLVLALMLAFLVLSGVLSESALRGIAVRRHRPRELFAERQGSVTLEIHNAQRRVAAYAIVVEDRVLDAERDERPAGRVFVLRLAPGAREVRRYRIRPERRGELAFAGFVVSTRFPFGLFSKSLALRAPESALVYPAVDPVGALPELGAGRKSGSDATGEHGHGSEVTGLREFAHGDAPRRIDWRASLRARSLWVREVKSEQEREAVLRLRTRGRAPGEAFERDVRACASEAVALLEAGARVGLRTDTEQLPPERGARQRARLLAFLARVEPEADTAPEAAA